LVRGETANRDQDHSDKPTSFGPFRQRCRPNHRGCTLTVCLLRKAKRRLSNLCLSEGRAGHGVPRFLTECREDSRGGSAGEMRGERPFRKARANKACARPIVCSAQASAWNPLLYLKSSTAIHQVNFYVGTILFAK